MVIVANMPDNKPTRKSDNSFDKKQIYKIKVLMCKKSNKLLRFHFEFKHYGYESIFQTFQKQITEKNQLNVRGKPTEVQ